MTEHQQVSEEPGRSQSPLTLGNGICQNEGQAEEQMLEAAAGLEMMEAEKNRHEQLILDEKLDRTKARENIDGLDGTGGFKWPEFVDTEEGVDTTERLESIEGLDMTEEFETAVGLQMTVVVQETEEMEIAERLQETEKLDGAEGLEVATEGWKAEEMFRKSEIERAADIERRAEIERRIDMERTADVDSTAKIEKTAEMERKPEIERTSDMDSTAKIEKTAEMERKPEIERTSDMDSTAKIERTAEMERELEIAKTSDMDSTAKIERTVEMEGEAETGSTTEVRGTAEEEKTERRERMEELESTAGLESVTELERIAGAERRDVLESTELTFPHGVFQRVRRDTMESQASSIDFSDDALESDDSSDVGFHRPPVNSDPISASVRRRLNNRSQPRQGPSSSEDETDQDGREPFPPVLQRSTTFERVLSDAIVHQAPIEELKVILDAGAKLMDPTARKPNPIHYTVWQRYPDAAELLLQQGYDVNALDDFGYSALHLASRHGYTDMMEILIKHESRINFNAVDTEDRFPIDAVEEPLRLAMKYGHHDAAKLLLENGANPNGRYFFGSEINLASPLQPELLELLVEFGARVDEQDRNGLTPIMKACRLRRGMDSLLLLLSYGGNVNIRADGRHDHRTALHYAVLSGSLDIVSVLLDSGAQIRFEPEYNRPTPLHLAVRRGDITMINLLIDVGSDINSSTTLIGSVLHMACSEKVTNRLEVMDLLLARGADPNIIVPGLDGSPMLPPLGDYLAASDEHDPNVISLLLRYGAEVIMRSPQNSPLGLLGCVSSLRQQPLILEELLEGAQQFDLELIRYTSLLGAEERRLCLEIAGSPLSLRHLSRVCLRHESATARPESVLKMELPSIISKYLLYEIS